jgi:hypothetical protein
MEHCRELIDIADLNKELNITNMFFKENISKEIQTKIINKYKFIEGITPLIKSNSNEIEYEDVVTHQRVNKTRTNGNAVFRIPKFDNNGYKLNILESVVNIDEKVINNIINSDIFKNIDKPFDFINLEKCHKPVEIDLPKDNTFFIDNFVLNQDNTLKISVLNIPIKTTLQNSKLLRDEGRVAFDGSEISHNYLYIPNELNYIKPIIDYVNAIELKINKNYLENNFVFVTIDCNKVIPNTSQRRGGFHIDGLQGNERINNINFNKFKCNRQYLICNSLPTEYINKNISISKVEKYCQENNININNINIQDIIQQECELLDKEQIKCVKINTLNLLDTYVIHRSSINNTEDIIDRTFVRIIVSEYDQGNRLGDTINPLLGPLFKYKIKMNFDLLEVDI